MLLPRSIRRVVALGALVLAAPALRAQETDRRPTVAVLPFVVAAMVKPDEYAPLDKGIEELMITTLANNPNVRVVERSRIQKVIEELNLGKSDLADKDVAARIGKIVGAQHMLTGALVVDPRNVLMLTVRAIRTETTEILFADKLQGKGDDVFALIDRLGTQTNTKLKLPAMPVRLPSGSAPGDAATGGRDAAPAKGSPAHFRAVLLVSRALERQDRGDVQGAIALYRSALQEYPEFERAKTLLASAESGAPTSARPR